MPRALNGSTSIRSIFPARREVAQVEAALKLRRRALGAERDLEAPRHERALVLGLGSNERLEVAPELPHELAPLELGEFLPHPGHRLLETAVDEAHGVVDVPRLDALRAQLLRKPRVEAVEHRVRERSAEARVHLCVDLLRRDDALEEPDGRAGGERLELGRVEAPPSRRARRAPQGA